MRSLQAFKHHILKVPLTSNQTDEPPNKSKLIRFLLDEAYFDYVWNNQATIEPISDLCFINCVRIDDERNTKQLEKVEKNIEIVRNV